MEAGEEISSHSASEKLHALIFKCLCESVFVRDSICVSWLLIFFGEYLALLLAE
jgi:hypothetical protein